MEKKEDQPILTRILAIDLGTNAGWCYTDEIGTESGFWMAKTFAPWAKCFLEVLDKYHPEIIVCSQTNNGFGHMNATKKMYMYYGIVCLLCEKQELPVVELNDSSARKNLFGIGKGKKEYFHKLFDERFPKWIDFTGDQKDATVLALGWKKLQGL